MLQQLTDAVERLGLSRGKELLGRCMGAPSMAMAASLAVISAAIGPIREGVVAEATNYVRNLINPFTCIAVPEDDPNYYNLWNWITRMRNDDRYRSVMSNSRDAVVRSDAIESGGLKCGVPDGTVLYIRYEGYTISAKLQQDNTKTHCREPSAITLRVMSRDHGPLLRLVEEAAAYARRRAITHMKIYSSNGGGYGSDAWRVTEEVPRYDMDNSKHDPEVVADIIADAERFLRQRARYERCSTTWKRGYLLYGPPGTGKTTLIRLLASHLGMDLAVAAAVSLSESRIRNLPRNTVLAVEDIDCGMKGREDASLGFLLNALDGIGSGGGGRIIIITTNHVGRLDPALVRPGRVDVTYKIGEPNGDQLAAAYCAYFAESAEQRPRLDLAARAFDLARVPADVRDEAGRFAALVAGHGKDVQLSCALVEGILNRALERDCVAEVTLKCLQQMRELAEEAKNDKRDPLFVATMEEYEI